MFKPGYAFPLCENILSQGSELLGCIGLFFTQRGRKPVEVLGRNQTRLFQPMQNYESADAKLSLEKENVFQARCAFDIFHKDLSYARFRHSETPGKNVCHLFQ